MAIFNETLEGRFNKIITSLHGTKGHTPAPQITPEIGHHIILENDRPEYHFLASSTRFSSGRIVINADATHFSSVQFLNPANSGTLAVIEALILNALSAQYSVIVAMFPGAFVTSPASSFPLDSRETPTKKSALTNFINNQLVGTSGNFVANATTVANADREIIEARNIVLAPGGVLGVISTVINQAVQCTLIHRERAISPNELISR
jgi:hypothetical protein